MKNGGANHNVIMKIFNIYFRHYDRVLSITAHHFSVENGVATFYRNETEEVADFYIALEAVGAIVTEADSDASSTDRVLTSGKGVSKKLHGF